MYSIVFKYTMYYTHTWREFQEYQWSTPKNSSEKWIWEKKSSYNFQFKQLDESLKSYSPPPKKNNMSPEK